jgi:hypothetical protein
MWSVENVECFVFECCFVLNRVRIYFNINIFATLLLPLPTMFGTVLLNIQMNLCMHKLKTIVLEIINALFLQNINALS